MVVGTSLAVATVMTAGAAAPAIATAAVAGGAEGIVAGSAAVGAVVAGGTSTGAAVGASVATATAAGAITGAAGGTVGAVATGAVAGATSAAGVGGSGAGVAAALGIGSGPVGWIVLGAETGSDGSQITYDCWKSVIHDTSEEPSKGMLLKDVMCHPHVANVSVTPGTIDKLPYIVLENIWEEKFEIQYLVIRENNRLVCHANAL